MISSADEESFPDPIDVDKGGILGRVDVAVLADGTTIVTWLATSEDGVELRARAVDPTGAMGDIETIDQLPHGRRTGFPRIAAGDDHVVVVWTGFKNDESSEIRVARLSLLD